MEPNWWLTPFTYKNQGSKTKPPTEANLISVEGIPFSSYARWKPKELPRETKRTPAKAQTQSSGFLVCVGLVYLAGFRRILSPRQTALPSSPPNQVFTWPSVHKCLKFGKLGPIYIHVRIAAFSFCAQRIAFGLGSTQKPLLESCFWWHRRYRMSLQRLILWLGLWERNKNSPQLALCGEGSCGLFLYLTRMQSRFSPDLPACGASRPRVRSFQHHVALNFTEEPHVRALPCHLEPTVHYSKISPEKTSHKMVTPIKS